MPIEIKEITIKADIYPKGRQEQQQASQLSPAALEKLKKEIKQEVLEAIRQQLQQTAIDR